MSLALKINEDINFTWQQIQKDLTSKYGEATFHNWFSKLKLVSSSKSEVTLATPTNFMRQWIITYYLDVIKKYWVNYNPSIVKVDIIVKSIQKDQKKTENIQTNFFAESTINNVSNDLWISTQLEMRFSFDNFIVDSSNELAYHAALNIAKADIVNPKTNPLFIYGNVGLGKTHLIQSIAAYINTHNPTRRVIYMSAEKFMYQFVKALKNRDIMNFKEQFRNIDVLIIDDVQFICGKESTQEEFFHTFDSLIATGKQIIISCDRLPNNLLNIEERMKSRLGGGLIADVAQTNYKLRVKILESKLKNLNISINKQVIEFLATNITTSVRELEGALNKVIAHSDLRGMSINLDNTKYILQDMLNITSEISIYDIQKQICIFFNINKDDLTSDKRSRIYTKPRQIAMYLAKILTQRSLTDIGKSFKRKDHTTVMHAVKNIELFRTSDSNLNSNINSIIAKLKK